MFQESHSNVRLFCLKYFLYLYGMKKNTIKKGADPGIILELLLSDFINILPPDEKSDLLKTENRYIIYTTNFHIYKNKLYIKNNNYGIGLMYYRNYLKSIEPYNVLPVISNYELVEYNPIYSTLNVEGGPAFVYSEFNRIYD